MRWVKGQSGNPRGRPPRARYLSEAIHAALQRTVGEEGQTLADVIALAMVKRAATGDVRAAEFVRDTVEGKPAMRVSQEADDKPIRFAFNIDGAGVHPPLTRSQAPRLVPTQRQNQAIVPPD